MFFSNPENYSSVQSDHGVYFRKRLPATGACLKDFPEAYKAESG